MQDYTNREYACRKCGAVNEVELRPKGTAIGCHCKRCGQWLKWVTKDEAHAIKLRFGRQEDKSAELPDELIINGVTYVRKKESE